MNYDDRLSRAMERSPDIGTDQERLDVPEPSVRQEGNATVYENFQATVDALGRDEDHVVRFLRNELGTSGHIDESGRARLTGSFAAERLGGALETYVAAFVRCPECGLPDTVLERENGAVVRRCEACGARSPTS